MNADALAPADTTAALPPAADTAPAPSSFSPLVEIEVTLFDLKATLGVLAVVGNLLTDDEIADAARPAALILHHAARDIERGIERVEVMTEIAMKRAACDPAAGRAEA